jgi:putative ABC transport system ATP-binding protein
MIRQAPALFELQQVTKAYRLGREPVPIFDGLSLTVRQNDFIALMGPSGSGKTTLLNLLGGLDRPSSGSVAYKGIRIDLMKRAALSAWRADNVGFVFQSYNLMPTLTALQNVELPLLLRRLSPHQRRTNAQTALELVSLADRARHKPRQLSGGQQQRVALARALVTDPEVILADEPTGDLDRRSASQIMELFRTLNTQLGKTIVMVTHDPEAAGFARTILRMDKGEILSPKEAAA